MAPADIFLTAYAGRARRAIHSVIVFIKTAPAQNRVPPVMSPAGAEFHRKKKGGTRGGQTDALRGFARAGLRISFKCSGNVEAPSWIPMLMTAAGIGPKVAGFLEASAIRHG